MGLGTRFLARRYNIGKPMLLLQAFAANCFETGRLLDLDPCSQFEDTVSG